MQIAVQLIIFFVLSLLIVILFSIRLKTIYKWIELISIRELLSLSDQYQNTVSDNNCSKYDILIFKDIMEEIKRRGYIKDIQEHAYFEEFFGNRSRLKDAVKNAKRYGVSIEVDLIEVPNLKKDDIKDIKNTNIKVKDIKIEG